MEGGSHLRSGVPSTSLIAFTSRVEPPVVEKTIIWGNLHESEFSFNPEHYFKFNSCLHERLS